MIDSNNPCHFSSIFMAVCLLFIIYQRFHEAWNVVQLNFRLINWLFEAAFSISFQLSIHFLKSIILRMESDNEEFHMCCYISF